MRLLVACFSHNKGGMELNSIDIADLIGKKVPTCYVSRSNTFLSRNNLQMTSVDSQHAIAFSGNLSIMGIFKFRRLLKTERISHVLFFGASELKTIVPAITGLNIELIQFHGTAKKHSKKDFFHKLFYRHVKRHVVISDFIRANVFRIIPYSTKENTQVIGLPTRIPQTIPPKNFSTAVRFLNVARIAEGKGQLDSILCLAAIRQKGIQAQLTLVGGIENNNYYERLLKAIDDNGLKQHVFFKGFLKDVTPHLESSHFLMFPSSGEGLSNSILEAMSYGCIPITYSNTVFPEYIQMGFDFPQAKDQNLEDLITQTLSLISQHNESLEELSLQNFNLVKKLFSEEKIQSDYLKLLSNPNTSD